MSDLRLKARRQGPLLALLGVGLLVRMALLWSVADLDLKIGDERQYHQLATNIVDGHGFGWGPGHLTSMRPPLYPAFVAAVWAITGTHSLQAIRVAQAALAIANTVVLYYIGVLLFDRRVALLAAAGFCLYPSLLFNGVLLLSETLFTVLLSSVVLGYVLLLRSPSRLVGLATGCALGLAALTRSVLWPFPIILCPLAFFTVRGSLRTRLEVSALVFAGYALIVSPWAVRNTRLQGVFTIVDTMGGLNLRMGNYEYTPHDRMWAAVSLTGEKEWSSELGREHPEATHWTEGEKERWARTKAFAYMRNHPMLTLQRSAIRFADFWGLERELVAGFQQRLYEASGWLVGLVAVAVTTSYGLMTFLAGLGVYLAGPTDRRAHAFLILVVVFVCGVHTVVFGHSRYHLPLVPILALYAAAAVGNRSWTRLGGGVTVAAGPLITITTLVAIWARELFVQDAGRIREFFSILQ